MNAPTAPPVGSIQFFRVTSFYYTLREYNGTSFTSRVLAIEGGGTSATDAAAARANLGIGTMGIQNSNAVSISGGSIANLNGFTLSTSIVFTAGGAYDLASNGARVRRGYFSDALVLPAGVDKYATS